MSKLVFHMVFALVAGLFFAINSSVAEVRVLPNEHVSSTDEQAVGWSIPEDNTILILPPRLTGKYLKELPQNRNFTAISRAIASELQRVVAAEVKVLDQITYPEKWRRMRKDLRMAWLADLGQEHNARTVFQVDLDIKSTGSSSSRRHFGVPVAYVVSPNGQWVGVSAVMRLEASVIDTGLKIPVAKIEGEGHSFGTDLSSCLGSEVQLREALSKEVEAMAQRAASDLAFECRVHRLLVLRPEIKVTNIGDKQKKATVSIGSAMGVEKKFTFTAFRQEGENVLPVAKLTADQVANDETLCKVNSVKRQLLTEDMLVIPYDAKVAGALRLPRKPRQSKSR